MPDDKAQDAEQEPAQDVREPVHPEVHAKQPPRKRQENHEPAILRHRKEHRRSHRQVVHRVARGETVLVERRNLRLDFRVRGKRTRTLGIELDHLVNHETHRERHERLPENREEAVPADLQENKQRERAPDIAISQAHIKLEPAIYLRRKMAVRPVDRNTVVKICDFLEHRVEFRIIRRPIQ